MLGRGLTRWNPRATANALTDRLIPVGCRSESCFPIVGPGTVLPMPRVVLALLAFAAALERPLGVDGVVPARGYVARRPALPAWQLQRRRGSSSPLLCAAGPAAQSKTSAARRPRLLLGALVLIYVSNQWCRALPASLVRFGSGGSAHEFMNVALELDEVQYGLLSSYAFTALYSVASLAAGAACDIFARAPVLVAASALWSGAAALQGCASSYPQLLASRAVLGVSQAFCSPAAYPLIGEAFSKDSRGRANAVYSSGLYIGYALASLSALANRRIGWRAMSLLTAAFSLLASATLAAVAAASRRATINRSPPQSPPLPSPLQRRRRQHQQPPQPPQPQLPPQPPSPPSLLPPAAAAGAVASLGRVCATRSASLLLLASTVRSFCGYAVGAWSVPFFRQCHPEHASQFALANGAFIAIGGTVSTIAGGWLSDRLVQRRPGGRAHLRPTSGPSRGNLDLGPISGQSRGNLGAV